MAEQFTLDIPERHVDAGDRQRENTARTGTGGGAAELLCDGFDAQRIFANDQFAELIDGVLQSGAERAAKKSRADSFNAVLRLHPQNDELIMRAKIRRAARQGLVERYAQDV